MKTTLIAPNRLLLEFPTKKEMNLSCFRISEFTEGNEKVCGRYFTADEFIDAYSDEKGHIDYFSYWEGHNFSKKELMEFKDAFTIVDAEMFKNRMISNREGKIIKASQELADNGYIITMVEGDEITLKHETAHALFFENEEYQRKAIEIVNDLEGEVIEKYRKHLRDMGAYSEDVFIDEIHAYLVAFDEDEHSKCFPSITEDNIYSHRANLQGNFDKYNK